jgi:hypothetical protein
MFRTGIYNLAQLKKSSLKDWFGKEKNISLSIDYELLNSTEPNKDELQEKIFFRAKIGHFYKMTFKNRFADIDKQVVNLIDELFKGKQNISIHDIGASDGRTSVEFYNILKSQIKSNILFTASDLYTDLKLYKYKKHKILLVKDDCDILHEIVAPPFVFTVGRNESWFYFLNKLYYKILTGKIKHLDKVEQPEIISFQMIHHSCYFEINQSDNFRFITFDLFHPSDQKYDVVRLMNLLHPGYFSNQDIYIALKNIFNILSPQGILITGGNKDQGSFSDASVYQKNENRLINITHYNSGCRIHDIIQNFQM